LILTTSINILTISYHIHSYISTHPFTFQSQSQTSQELQNHQYYSISIISKLFLSNPQISKNKQSKQRTFFLA